MDPEIVIREATVADGPLCAKIERQSPLVMGDRSLTIDRGDDYFAAARLMEAPTVLIAEVDGVPAGVMCGAPHAALIGGTPRRMLYVHHARILPSFQGGGVGLLLARTLATRYEGQIDSQYWYISPGNANSQSFTRRAPNRWSIRPAMVGIDTAARSGAPAGRPATAADAAAIARLINLAHEDEEMFVPYTAESLRQRVERAPGQYGWERVWTTGHAVVGAWPEGERISLWTSVGGAPPMESRGAAVLDFGYERGHEAELVGLLRAWCGWLAPRGLAELSVFSSPGTRHWELLSSVGEHTEFDFWTPSLPEPPGVEHHGLYVDHAYF